LLACLLACLLAVFCAVLCCVLSSSGCIALNDKIFTELINWKGHTTECFV
jgi:hypothetical protein